MDERLASIRLRWGPAIAALPEWPPTIESTYLRSALVSPVPDGRPGVQAAAADIAYLLEDNARLRGLLREFVRLAPGFDLLERAETALADGAK